MERKVSERNILDDFCISFCKIIEKYTEYIIVLGFVVIASGRARGTEDIGLIIKPINKNLFKELHEELEKNGFSCMQSNDYTEIYSYLNENLSVRYTKNDMPLPEMEMKFTKDELDNYQLKTKTKLEITGLDIYFSSVEMNIAFKEGYLKSEKDIEDAVYLRKIYEINEEEIDKIKKMIKEYRLK